MPPRGRTPSFLKRRHLCYLGNMSSKDAVLGAAAGAGIMGVGMYYFFIRKAGVVAQLRLQLSECAQARAAKIEAAIKPPIGHYGYPELPTPPLPKILTYAQEQTPEWYQQDLGVDVPQILPQTPSF